ncbi:hypothetical protein CONPUDRAFT_150454 [Coniophora puteana RWD-64-598 SS2]|uniref:Uncharacterized protein n=1 Tax=Coniophora puteana (strain RWD-64-598) TaxID=741705 RepID=A0A5M3N3R3_CONPW|nr:uncharacterized protein CONPUDRAFT_150454 [Coniophora puteana RWD-64-598 SS2]EIW85654.1 hypothetical protein CONPUDRAFT_150454 [Coniophora puteana RWD-64-598 SS2]
MTAFEDQCPCSNSSFSHPRTSPYHSPAAMHQPAPSMSVLAPLAAAGAIWAIFSRNHKRMPSIGDVARDLLFEPRSKVHSDGTGHEAIEDYGVMLSSMAISPIS